jgi:hypothetical protein
MKSIALLAATAMMSCSLALAQESKPAAAEQKPAAAEPLGQGDVRMLDWLCRLAETGREDAREFLA